MIDQRKLTPAQVEALIQFEYDPGVRGLHVEDGSDTESKVELEAYVASREDDQAEVAA